MISFLWRLHYALLCTELHTWQGIFLIIIVINGQLIEMIICHHQVNHQIGTHERSATITFRKLDTLIQTCMKRSLAGTPLAVVLSWCGGWVQCIYWIQNWASPRGGVSSQQAPVCRGHQPSQRVFKFLMNQNKRIMTEQRNDPWSVDFLWFKFFERTVGLGLSLTICFILHYEHCLFVSLTFGKLFR